MATTDKTSASQRASHSRWCSAIGCSNSQGKFPHLSFFSFPKDEERCRMWVQYSRRQDLLEKTTERLCVTNHLCEMHFDNDQFAKPTIEESNRKRKRLCRDAVPTVYPIVTHIDKVTKKRKSHRNRKIPMPDDMRELPSCSLPMRSHLCGDLNVTDIGKTVTLCGWVQHQRYDLFLILKDWSGLIQVVLPSSNKSSFKPSLQSVVQVRGEVFRRPPGQQNKEMKTGEIEVVAATVDVLSSCSKQNVPVLPSDFNKVNEDLRLEYRYLDIRTDQMQYNLRLRSDVINKMRHFLCVQNGFVEVETPILFRRTPGGANEFVVPSKFPGQFYSLPQSPQQFKQLLMVGGIDRYMQVARCYRDEATKSDRQPEFTQLDIEMSFVSQDDIKDITQSLIEFSWPTDHSLPSPFYQMTYLEAMTLYGTDKPDLRLEWKLQDLTSFFNENCIHLFENNPNTQDHSIQVLKVPDGSKHLSSSEISKLISETKKQFACDLTVIKFDENRCWPSNSFRHLTTEEKRHIELRLSIESCDLVFISRGNKFIPHEALGKLRLDCAHYLEIKDVDVRQKDSYAFVWITNFPLFLSSDKNESGLESSHHPFTSPVHEHIHKVYSDPSSVTGQHYDLVLNGQEIAGGSIRIHDAALQKYILTDVLKEDSNELQHLLTALECGCPPHGGIALGLDRYLAILCGAQSIRDVIAFPKSNTGRDVMAKAPAPVSQSILDYYHIKSTQ